MIEIVGYGFLFGIFFAIFAFGLGFFMNNSSLSIYWLLPIITYLFSALVIGTYHKLSCNTFDIQTIAKSSAIPSASVVFFLLLSMIGFVRSIVKNVLPLDLQNSFGDALAVSFYMFWAGIMGGQIGLGMASAC